MIAEELQGRTIGFKRGYMRVVGSVTAALLLSQAMHWQDWCTTRGRPEWHKTAEEWEEETGLTRREVDGARAKLRALGVLLEVKRGIPAKIWYRVDEARLTELLVAAESDAPKRQPVRTKAPNSMHESANLYAPKRQPSTEITQRSLHIPPHVESRESVPESLVALREQLAVPEPAAPGSRDVPPPADETATEVWREVKAAVSAEIGRQRVQTWLAPLEPVGVEGGVLVLRPPAAEAFADVGLRYGSYIRDALAGLRLDVREVRFAEAKCAQMQPVRAPIVLQPRYARPWQRESYHGRRSAVN